MERRWTSRACVGSKRRKWRYERAARAPAARLAARRFDRGGHPNLRIGGRSTSWTLYCLFAVLVCCANRHAPTSTLSTGFCLIWVCISSSSSSLKKLSNDSQEQNRVPARCVNAAKPATTTDFAVQILTEALMTCIREHPNEFEPSEHETSRNIDNDYCAGRRLCTPEFNH